jgi:hypothetical protein
MQPLGLARTVLLFQIRKIPNPKHVWSKAFQIRGHEPVEELHFNVMKEGGWQKNL